MKPAVGVSILCAAALLILQSCDPTTSGPDPMRARYSDPPVLYTFLTDAMTLQASAVRVEFPSYTTNVIVTAPGGFNIQRVGVFGFPAPWEGHPRPQFGQGGGAFPPDPDEFQFDPWDDVPEPVDIPFPPDDPFEDIPLPPPPPDDPFDGLPDPPFDLPPLPGGDLPTSHLTPPGTLTIFNTGGPTSSNFRPALVANAAVKVAATVAVGSYPGALASSPDRKTLYVAVGGNSSIAVVNRTTNTVASQISLPTGSRPYALAITPDGTKLFTGDFSETAAPLYAVTLPAGTVKQLNGGGGNYISQAIVTPDGTQVWYCSYYGNVEIFDVLTNTYITGLPISFPWNVAFNASGTRAYVTNGAEGVTGFVAVVDTATLKTIASIQVGKTPRAVRVTPSGRHVFVINTTDTIISQIDTATNTVIRSIKIPGINATGLGFSRN